MEFFFVLVFFVCLLFLAFLFGNQLSIFGLRDNRWLTAPLNLLTWFWNLVCEAFDRASGFVIDQFWWVLATSSASIGMLLIALLIVSGLSVEAKAIRADLTGDLNVGNVLDKVVAMEATENFPPDERLIAASDDDPATRQLYQTPTFRNRFLATPMPVVPENLNEPQDTIVTFPPPLESSVNDTINVPQAPKRQRLSITMQPFIERRGVPIFSEQRRSLIDQALSDVERQNPGWRVSSAEFETTPSRRQALSDDSQLAEERLLSSVRIIPGDFVAESNLDVVKNVPQQPASNEFDVEILVRNLTNETVDGVVVRELLPEEWVPVNMFPEGIYRNSVATWVVDQLRANDQQKLILTVRANREGSFESMTEVSAIAAVTTPTIIEAEELPLPVFPREPVRDPIALPLQPPREPERRPERFDEPREELPRLPPRERIRRRIPVPDVRLTFDDRPYRVNAGDLLTIKFTVSNLGDAPAENVVLRIELPDNLSHHTKEDDPTVRYITARIRKPLQPNERREMTFEARPELKGRYEPVAELLFEDKQIELTTFIIDAQEPPEPPPLRPRPEF